MYAKAMLIYPHSMSHMCWHGNPIYPHLSLTIGMRQQCRNSVQQLVFTCTPLSTVVQVSRLPLEQDSGLGTFAPQGVCILWTPWGVCDPLAARQGRCQTRGRSGGEKEPQGVAMGLAL